MPRTPLLSLIVPTRQRPALLQTFLDSVAATADAPNRLEVVLVIDSDDPDSLSITCDGLRIRRIIVRPGRTMGELNTAGYEASVGRYLMLLNDDVIARTPGWDTDLLACFAACPDGILLVHVNDRLFETVQCTFPVVSRTFCRLVGELCPTEYVRYRIDDHIEDIFNLLGVLGARRTVYLPDVVFEHRNYRVENGDKHYCCDPAILASDAKRFAALLPERKEVAVCLMAAIKGSAPQAGWVRRLEPITDSFALRVPERLRVMRRTGTGLREESAWLRRVRRAARKVWHAVRRAG